MSLDWLPPDAWQPVTAPVTTGSAYRAPAVLDDIVDQFQVQTAPRYQPRDGQTFCNIFVWDVTRALGAEVPHWWLGKEQSANDLLGWLTGVGVRHGWHETTGDDAQACANIGRPAVVIWQNQPGKPGHVALVVPARGSGVWIAQAGASNFVRRPLAEGFGSLPVRYFTHS